MHQSRFSPSQSRYVLAYRSGKNFTRPLVTAYDAADGEPTWNHPVGAGDRAATVVAEEAGSGTVFVLEVSPTGDGRETRSRLVALDSEGGAGSALEGKARDRLLGSQGLLRLRGVN